MNGIVLVLVVVGVLLPGLCLGQGKMSDADRALWVDIKVDMPKQAVKRLTDKYPLSDQLNVGKWKKYSPMSDEFKGKKLDEKKWFPVNPTWKGRQPAWFDPENVVVKDGSLQLTMRKAEPAAMPKNEGYNTYTSAAVQSKETTLYGYYEVRAKPMNSAGSSAFWFYKGDPDRWTEIDVFEIGGKAAGFERKMHITVHVMRTLEYDQHQSVGSAYEAPFNLADDFHVYGLEWNEKELKFYFDGMLVRKGPNTHWTQPLTLNFDSETMPDWFGLPKDEDLPSTYYVDYIRAWKAKG